MLARAERVQHQKHVETSFD